MIDIIMIDIDEKLYEWNVRKDWVTHMSPKTGPYFMQGHRGPQAMLSEWREWAYELHEWRDIRHRFSFTTLFIRQTVHASFLPAWSNGKQKQYHELKSQIIQANSFQVAWTGSSEAHIQSSSEGAQHQLLNEEQSNSY